MFGQIHDGASLTFLKSGRHPFNLNDRELLTSFAALRPKIFKVFLLYINILLLVKKKNQYIVVFLKAPTSHPSSHSILKRHIFLYLTF